MRIQRMVYQNWKGMNCDWSLGALNLLIGPTGSGKSALMLGPTFAITGTTPIGKTNDATALFGAVSGCSVRMELDDGFAATQILQRDTGKSKRVSRAVEIDDQPRLQLADADAAIHAKCGNYAPMFDLSAFFGLSPDNRRDAIVRLSRVEQAWNRDEAMARIGLEAMVIHLGEQTVDVVVASRYGVERSALNAEQAAEVTCALSAQLDETHRRVLFEKLDALRGAYSGDVATALSVLVDETTTMTKTSKQQHDAATQASRKLSSERAELQVTAESVDELETQLAELTQQREEFVQQIAHQEGRGESLQKLEQRVERCRNTLTEARKAVDEFQVPDAPTDQQIAEARESLERATRLQTLQADHQNVRELLSQAEAQRSEIQRQIDNLHQESAAALDQGPVPRLCRACDSLLEVFLAETVPPTNSLESALKDFQKVWHETSSEIQGALQIATEVAVDATSKRENELQALDDKLESLKQRDSEAAEKMSALQLTHGQTASVEELSQHVARLDEQRRTSIRASEDLERLRQVADQSQQAATEAEKELEDLRAAGGFVPDTELASQRDRLQAQADEIKERLKQRRQADLLKSKLDDCIAQAEREQINHDVSKLLGGAVRRLRETLMKDLVKPLTAGIDTVIQPVFPNVEAYCLLENERGRPIFELGWIKDIAQRISLQTLSGGQRMVYLAGVAYALVSQANPPLKLLMIEAAEIDAPTLGELLDALEPLADEFSNIIVATHVIPDTVSPEWSVEELGTVAVAN